MKMPFEIGDALWAPKTSSQRNRVPCPVCVGTGVVILLYGGEERVSVGCEACGLGFDGPRGYIEEWDYTPAATPFVIAGVSSFYDGRWNVSSTTGETMDFDKLCKTEAEALAASAEACAAQHERNMESRQSARRSAKRASWTVLYHRKCIADLEQQIAWHTAKINAKPKEKA